MNIIEITLITIVLFLIIIVFDLKLKNNILKTIIKRKDIEKQTQYKILIQYREVIIDHNLTLPVLIPDVDELNNI